MFECLILGDSIAVGTHLQRYECESYSKGGINSWQWNKMFGSKDLTANTVIISLGSNDHKYIKTYDELQKLRNKVKASRVFWVLPAGNLKASEVDIETIRILIREIAVQFGDTVLPISRVSKDGIHPSWAGYRELADKTKEK